MEKVNESETLSEKEAGIELCFCNNVEVGSYANQVILKTPEAVRNMKAKWNERHGTTVCEDVVTVDRCLKNEIQYLWSLGITTTGCCCGHNKIFGYIGVIEDDIPKMLSMGYLNVKNPTDACRRDSFVPKSI